ncbi:MAG: PSD1 and planctomycete cytochrome C domain-containing protein [Verrucomicrobiota bacterium]
MLAVEFESFEKNIQPLLQERCVKCHGPEKQKGGLRLDSRAELLRGGDDGLVIASGKSSESPLISRVSGVGPDKVMPPKGDRLTIEQIDLLRKWIDLGVPWPEVAKTNDVQPTLSDHWAFQPPKLPPVPAVRNRRWARNPIDHFVLAQLEEKGLAAAPEADRRTLVRRLSLDLAGLPPTPEVVETFINDPRSDAYERLVDRLLASPHYGERSARYWLDLARFSESHGFEYDKPRDHAWRYRDYVIRSFNSDKTYPQFIREQLAGDVLEPITRDGIIASSFLVAGPWDEVANNQVGQLMKARARDEELEDVVSAVAQTFLGLTVNCARCHAHKFDPIPQADYYRFKSVFQGVRYGDRPILTPDELQSHSNQVTQLKQSIGALENQIAEMEPTEEILQAFTDSQSRQRASLLAELQSERGVLGKIPTIPLAYAGSRQQPEPTHRLVRGDVEREGELVSPGALSVVAKPSPEFGLAPDAPEADRRRRFAEWICNADHPLTARVMVNRIWQQHFGNGIVGTPSDFGVNGERPSHPELLDWLALQFIEQGWSVKQLHRLIVTSSTYRQSSIFNHKAAGIDADNRLLWHFAPRRLEGEAVRDAILIVSGRLNAEMSGASFRPFAIESFGSVFYKLTDRDEPEFNRRTIYRMNVNSGKDPLLDVFDCPDPSFKTPLRRVTTTPLQALSLMNNSFVQRQAKYFADRVNREAGESLSAQVNHAYLLAFGREPNPDESGRAALLAKGHGVQNVCWALLNASEFLYLK